MEQSPGQAFGALKMCLMTFLGQVASLIERGNGRILGDELSFDRGFPRGSLSPG